MANDLRFYPTAYDQAEISNVLLERWPDIDSYEFNMRMRTEVVEWGKDTYRARYGMRKPVPKDVAARLWRIARVEYPSELS